MKKNRKLRRVLCLVLAFTLCVGLFGGTVGAAEVIIASGECGDSLTWTLDSAGNLLISGTGAMDNWSKSGAPWNSYVSEVRTVSLPDGLTTIGDFAFALCSGLTGITIPGSVTAIGYYAFGSCASLSDITIPDRVASIGGYAFYSCSGLTDITIPDSVNFIDGYAFYACSGLTDITVPDSVSSIGAGLFQACTRLESITIPGSVTAVGDFAFEACLGLTDVYYSGTEAQWNAVAVGNSNGSLQSAAVHCSDGDRKPPANIVASGACGDNLTWTLDDAGTLSVSGSGAMTASMNAPWYSYNAQIQAVTLADGITSISGYAFSSCKNLSTITIPASVTTLTGLAFSDCTSLFDIQIDPDNAKFSAKDGAIYSKDGKTLVAWPVANGACRVPDGVAVIDVSAISSHGTSEITIPASVTSLSSNSFANCFALSAVHVDPDNPAFSSLDGVLYTKDMKTLLLCPCVKQGITIPDSVTAIGANAFANCGFPELTIPAGVVSLENTSLSASNISAFQVDPDNPAFSSLDGVLYTKDMKALLRSPAALKSITIPDGVTTICVYAFSNSMRLTSLTIPRSVTLIENFALQSCRYLTDVYYLGTKAQWDGVSVQNYNSSLQSAALHFRIPETVAAGDCGDTLSWALDDTGELVISGTGAMTSWQSPESVPWYPYRDQILTVSLSDGLTGIGNFAFSGCSGLTELLFPVSLTAIGDEILSGCSELYIVYYPGTEAQWSAVSLGDRNEDLLNASLLFSADPTATVASGTCGDNLRWRLDTGGNFIVFGSGAMTDYPIGGSVPWRNYSSTIRTITLPKGLTSIGSYAFFNCTEVTRISIPDSVTAIGRWTFLDCTGLTDLSLPDGLTSIGEYAFYGCAGLTSISIPSSVTAIGTFAFAYSCFSSIVIPEGVTAIGDHAFAYCHELTDINIPDSVTSIGYQGFADTPRLRSIAIPGSVVSIGEYAFWRSGLTEITVPHGTVSICGNAFQDCESLTSVTISDTVTAIDSSAFEYCGSVSDLTVDANNPAYCAVDNILYTKDMKTLVICLSSETALTIPDGVTAIGDHAFYNRRDLTDLTLPGSVAAIGDFAFYNCDGLTAVTLPESLTSIGSSAFENCDGLSAIAIPRNVAFIGSVAFSTCRSLTNIQVDPLNTAYCTLDGILYTGDLKLLLLCPGSHTACTLPESLTAIGEDAFFGCSLLTEIAIPSGVTEIGQGAFWGCTGLTEITIPSGVTAINGYLFDGCTGLTELIIPEGVTEIGSYAFFNCTGLTEITIPGSVTSIGSSLFYSCNGIRDVYYTGTEAQWNALSLGSSDPIRNAALHFVKPAPTADFSACTASSATVTVKNLGARTVSGILVAYDAEGRLLGVSTVTVPAGGKAEDLTVSIEGLATAKLFLLDADAGTPSTDVMTANP